MSSAASVSKRQSRASGLFRGEMRRTLSISSFPLSRASLAAWEGWCLELVNELLHSHPEGHILYVEDLPSDHRWRYHAALVLEGIVYDAWHPDVRLPPEEYVRMVFGPWATWEIMSDDDDGESS